MEDLLPSKLRELRGKAEEVAREVLAPLAEEIDRQCKYPQQQMHTLGEAGLLGLNVPHRFGGHDQGLLAVAVLTEVLAKACSSTAMCYGMHCVGTAVIAAKATHDQEQRYLAPIAEGRHITTLSLSETGTGSNFYIPQTRLEREDEYYRVNGTKQFVTSGGYADSYVVSTLASVPNATAGEFSCLIIDRDTPGLSWLDVWQGMGMRGNSSRGLHLENARVPVTNLLGDEGDEIWYMFEVVAPYFLIAMAGTYLGIAQAALDLTLQHMRTRRFDHSGETLAHVPVLQHRVAEMWMAVEKTRMLIYNAARLADYGDPQALVGLLSCKADVAATSIWVTNEALTLCGGMAYRENSTLARLLRDARASHVMSPSTDQLKSWAGRALLGLPLL